MCHTRSITVLFLALVFSCPVGWAAEPPWTRLVVFGDSLSDPGNAFVLLDEVSSPPYPPIPDAPYAVGGLHFSNGPTWIEQLARVTGLAGAGPALRDFVPFANYAVGAARARETQWVDLEEQLALYLDRSGGRASPEILYVFMIGGNDVRDALAILATDPSGMTSKGIIQEALARQGAALGTLAALGGRHFLVATVPDISLLPAVRSQGPLVTWTAHALATSYNQGLELLLDAFASEFPVSLHRLDLTGLLQEVVARPWEYGLGEATLPCITAGVIEGAVCENPDAFLFWDAIHPTRAGHALMAREAVRVLGWE